MSGGMQPGVCSSLQGVRQHGPLADRWTARLQRGELLGSIALALAFLVWFAWPVIWSASDNARLVGAFSTDEAENLKLLREAIDGRSLQLGYIAYGYAYLNLGLAPLLALSFFLDVTDQQIIVWLRLIPTLFGAGTVAVTFLLARRFMGRLTAWLAAVLLCGTVFTFLRLASMSHADVPQLFFLMLGLYYCCRAAEELRPAWLARAALSAGLAFGCKYSGLFLLPLIMLVGIVIAAGLDSSQIRLNRGRVVTAVRLVIAVASIVCLTGALVGVPPVSRAYVGAEYFDVSVPEMLHNLQVALLAAGGALALIAAMPRLWPRVRQRPRLVFLMRHAMIWALAFSSAFVLSSPFHVFSVRSGFVRGFIYESLHSSFGHVFEASLDPVGWIRMLSSPMLLSPLVVGLAAVGVVLSVIRTARRVRLGILLPEAILWLWSLFYLGFLICTVRVLTYRALLPIVPSLIVLAAASLCRVVRYVTSTLPQRPAAALTVAALLLFTALQLPPSSSRLMEYRRSAIAREHDSEVVLAGKWLAERFAHEDRVLHDPATYVTPAFADAHLTPFGGTVDMLAALQPDIVVANKALSLQFRDSLRAADYARSDDLFMAKYDYYRTLADGTAGYDLVRDFDGIQVYVR